MAKLRTRGKVAPVQCWINYETGRASMGRGKAQEKEKREGGYTLVTGAVLKEYLQKAGKA